MPNKVALCVIKIETDPLTTNDSEGAVSTEHPTNPRVQKERERDRGLRNCSEITIATYSNALWVQPTEAKQEITETETATATATATATTTTTVTETEDTMNAIGDRRREGASGSRDATPHTTEGQCAPEFPKEIGFFSGNPSVEITNGIIHLYKKNERRETMEAPSHQLCLLAVPASVSCHDLLSFVAPCHTEIQHIRIVRDGSPNQFMVLLEFRSNEAALEFYQTFNGAAYNSLEPDSVCHAVWVSTIERGDDGAPPLGHTELPTCPVCLERMDESVDGVLTILCNHAFHANCLVKWGDSTCPVCRHVQTPELLENSVCMECEGTEALWICLICGHVGCGRYQGGHAAAHFRATSHTFALQLGTSSVWDYAGDNFVHRLFQNKTDGKLVAAAQAPNDDGDEKIDSMQLEFTYLLTSQLDTQRKYYEGQMERLESEWHSHKVSGDQAAEKVAIMEQRIQALSKEKQTLERKLTNNTNRLKEVQKQLAEENQLSKAMQLNQVSWQTKYAKLEKDFKDYQEWHGSELHAVKERLRDVMFYMQAQTQIQESEMRDEIREGTVVVPEVPQPSTSSRRKKKH